MKTRGAVIVTRVSTGEQVKHGTSLESQLDACRTKALELGLPIVAEYEDAGISGAFLLSREGMQSALADIREGRADTLICASLSRYSRDTEHQQRIKKDVRAAGGRIVFCDMQFDETPEGDLNFAIQGSFAEYERGVIRARTMKGRAKRVDAGQQPSRAHSPYGYHIVQHADVTRGTHSVERLGRYEIVESEADVIRFVFEAYAAGSDTLSSLCRRLFEMGVKPRRAELWSCTTLTTMFTNPVYKGQPAAGRYRYQIDEARVGQMGRAARRIKTARVLTTCSPDEWTTLAAPAIVSEQTWQAVQMRLVSNRERKGGNPHRTYLLSGMVVCPTCGGKMTMKGRKTKAGRTRSYVCSRYMKAILWAGEARCDHQATSVPIVERAVIDAIMDAVHHPEAMEEAEAYYLEQARAKAPGESAQSEIETMRKKLADLVIEESATISAQVAGIRAGASPDAYASAFADIAARRSALEDRRKALSATLAVKPSALESGEPDWRRKALEVAGRALMSDLIEKREKRSLLDTIVQKVVCQPGGVDVYFFSSQSVQNICVTQNAPVCGSRQKPIPTLP